MFKKLHVTVFVVMVAFSILLVACGTVTPQPYSTPVPTTTKMPNHVPLPIEEQYIDQPVVIPTDNELWLYDSKVGDVSSIERAYERECRFKHPLPAWPCKYEVAYGWALMVVHNDTVIVYANKMAFDFRVNVVGLPGLDPNDRWIWGFEEDINSFVDNNSLKYNKHVLYVDAQTYSIDGGAEWELIAFGAGIQNQRWVRTLEGPFHQVNP